MTRTTGLGALIIAVGLCLAPSAGPARAQTAADINRLNQAMQICNSPMGAGLAECAALRAQVGGSLGSGIGGLFGKNTAPALNGDSGAAAAAQAAYAACIQVARLNQSAIAACNANLQATLGMQYQPGLTPPAMAGGDPGGMASYAAGKSYQQCVTSGTPWQQCMNAFATPQAGGLAPMAPQQPQRQAPPAAPIDPFKAGPIDPFAAR